MITKVVPQLWTTDMAASIHFYTQTLGFGLAFTHQDFYAGIQAADQLFHLKLIDGADPSIPFVTEGGHFHLYFVAQDVAQFAAMLKAKGVALIEDVTETAWGTREIVFHDDQGHTLYVGEST